MSTFKIGVLLFDNAELLDFAGPIQVFSGLHYLYPETCDSVKTIGLSPEIVVSKLFMKIIPEYLIGDFDDKLDMLLIPGGFGTRPLIKDIDALNRIETLCSNSERLATVCTGSLVAAKLGKLKGLRATTHYLATDLLKKIDPSITVDRSERFYDHGSIIVSEGVSAGIDMSFHLVEKYFGRQKADEVRKYIEYYPLK